MSRSPAANADAPRAGQKIDESRATLVVVDVQDRLFGAMREREVLAQNVARLARGAGLTGVPVVVTEQYPKGLQHTVKTVQEALPEGTPRVEKTAFSCLDEPAFVSKWDASRDQVVLAGVESHVCVLQSGLDFLARGATVYVVEDAVASRTERNRDAGIRRLVDAGAAAVTTEMVLFELVRGAEHPRFRDVQALIK